MSADDGMDIGVQTSAQEPDLFGGADDSTAASGKADCLMEFTGRLTEPAHVACRLVAQRTVPVLVLELDVHGPAAGHHVVAHIPFTESTRAEAERLAKGLQRGRSVKVRAALSDVRLFLPTASLSPDQPH